MRKRLRSYTEEDAIEVFNCFLDYAKNDKYILKPIAWALYHTWKVFDTEEKEKQAFKDDPNSRCPCD